MKKLLVLLLCLPFIGVSQYFKKFTDLVQETDPAIIQIYGYDKFGYPLGTGTGFFIEENGIAITNHHVIEDVEMGFIKDFNGNVFAIERVVSIDSIADLAKIEIKNDLGYKFHSLKIATTNILKGQEIFVIGNPNGLENTLSKGIISSIRNHPTFEEIQVTASISGGSSGSPILDMRGNVVGVIASGYDGTGLQQLNFGPSIKSLNNLEDGLIDNLTLDNTMYFMNIHNKRDYTVVLNSIEVSEKETLVHMSVTNLSLSWDTMSIWSSIATDHSWYIKDIGSKKEYHLLNSSLGTIHDPTYVALGGTVKFVLKFPPFEGNVPDSIDLLNGEFGSDWSFREIPIKNIYPDLSNPLNKRSKRIDFRRNNNSVVANCLQYALASVTKKEYPEAYYELEYLIDNTHESINVSYYKHIQGVIWYLYGDTILAKNTFQESTESNPNEATYYYNLFYVNNQLGDFKEALVNISTALSIVPDNLVYRRARAELNLELEDWRSVIKDASYCIENSITSLHWTDYLWRGLANEYLEGGYNNSGSCSDYESAYNLAPTTKIKEWIWENFYKDCK
jgi:serine protease Do